MRILRLLAAASAAAVLAVLTGSPAWAHNSLTDAAPAKNATLDQAPDRVKLTFLQRVDPDALSIDVTDSAGRSVPASGPAASGRTGTLTFDEPPANGVYTVTYRVVSLDGHPVEGSYEFTVDDPSTTPPPSPTATTSPAVPSPAPSSVVAAPAPETVPRSAESDSFPWWALIVGTAVVVALVVGGVLLRRRRSEPS
jgi:methionine-rich copper-binding protein CopC